jgi:hypothetical protein
MMLLMADLRGVAGALVLLLLLLLTTAAAAAGGGGDTIPSMLS